MTQLVDILFKRIVSRDFDRLFGQMLCYVWYIYPIVASKYQLVLYMPFKRKYKYTLQIKKKPNIPTRSNLSKKVVKRSYKSPKAIQYCILRKMKI